MSDFATARASMIDCQLRPNEVNDERIIEAIRAVARENFVPKAKRSFAYVDEDIEVCAGRFLLEPVTFARLLVAAGIKAGDLVLDVGCATGYSSAVIAGLADAVVALEEHSELAASAEKTLAEQDIMNVAVVKGSLAEGVAKQGPYDIIYIEGAVDEIPTALLNQMKDGGRLVCVLLEGGVGRGHMVENRYGNLVAQNLFDANVELLPGFSKEKTFVF